MIKLDYKNKKRESEILRKAQKSNLINIEGASKNKLILGENLGVLKTLMSDFDLKGKINLIYIDPPFSTKNCFTIGKDRVSTISNSRADDIAYEDNIVGDEFLEFLRERLIFLRELMSEKSSIYLHIDYKIGRRYTTVPLHAPGETMNGATGGEWCGIKPPKGRHWRSEPKVLDRLEKEGLIEWSANGVPRKKIFADEANGKRYLRPY